MIQRKGLVVFKLISSILLPQMAGFIGSFFTRAAVPTWYATLNKPTFTPPSGVFGPVWITLYLLMGISLFLVWRADGDLQQRRKALAVFSLQLALNTLWSILFFGLRSPLAGLAGIICLWIAIWLTIHLFSRISRMAALLLAPYLLWVSFAVVLNVSIFILNS
jgi:tryptophan-rich sensory protein